uniref:Amidotransferase n=1 Tax=Streptomyces sp. NBC_00003 TaxID=2903608 RepID=A0AAU2VD21_9ACTN
MNGLNTILIVVGLFLIGGIISFVKQGMPKSLIVLLSIGAAMCLTAGILRLDVWS